MKKHDIFTYFSVIIALALASVIFIKFNPESLLHKEDNPVSLKDISSDSQTSFTGKSAGDYIPRISGKKDFENMTFDLDCAAVTPVKVIRTNVYKLKPWVSSRRVKKTKGRTKTGKQKKSHSV